MAKVINDVVKMDWEVSDMLITKGKMFIVASQTYETENGPITVFFTASTCFLWVSEEGEPNQDIWNKNELFAFLRTDFDTAFPEMYGEYVPLLVGGSTACDDAILKNYGLLEFKEDIEKRAIDIAPYGELKDMVF